MSQTGPRRSYEIEPGPPAPSDEAYEAEVQAKWRVLLDSSPSEREVQAFLEANPVYVPGALPPGVARCAHYPLLCSLVSQPLLPGLNSRIPDFMWISKHSGAWFPTLIEIEKPSKRVFTSAGIPSAQFTQARNQLAQWRTWFSSPVNVQQFVECYGIPDDIRLCRQMKLRMILVYGRRREFEGIPELSVQRESLLPGDDEELMSFDRLKPDMDLANAITVRACGCGQYRAVRVPPLFSTGPSLADRLTAVRGLGDAIGATPMISGARRDFLRRRIRYWRAWVSQGPSGWIQAGDRE